MFGREPKLPVDVCFGMSNEEGSEILHSKYVENMKKGLKTAYELDKVNRNNKRRYDAKVHQNDLNPGDRVFIRNLGLKGKQKLADRRSSVIYVVEKQLQNLPVYQLVPESGEGQKKVLHRNHILPLRSPVRVNQDSEELPKRNCRARRKHLRQKEKKSDVTGTPVEDPQDVFSSESEFEYGYWPCLIRDSIPYEMGRPEVQDSTAVEEILPEPVSETDIVPCDGDNNDLVDHEVVEAVPVEKNDAQDGNAQTGVPPECVPEMCSETISETHLRRSERDRKPPNRFTYPQLGIPSKETVVISKYGDVYFPKDNGTCQVWWCNTHNLCKECLVRKKTSPCIVPRV